MHVFRPAKTRQRDGRQIVDWLATGKFAIAIGPSASDIQSGMKSNLPLARFEPRLVTFTMKGIKGTVLIPPRLITLEDPTRGWVRRLLKVVRRTTSWARDEVTLTCVDTRREFAAAQEPVTTSLSTRREALARVYQYVPGTIGAKP